MPSEVSRRERFCRYGSYGSLVAALLSLFSPSPQQLPPPPLEPISPADTSSNSLSPQQKSISPNKPDQNPEKVKTQKVEVLYHVPKEPNEKVVAITIDDGGNRWVMEAVKIATKYQIPLTFCLIGKTLKDPTQQQYIKEAEKTGLIQFCNHTSNHDMGFIEKGDEYIEKIIKEAEEELEAALGHPYPMIYFRPPGGAGGYHGGSPCLKNTLGKLNYRYLMMWDTELVHAFKKGEMSGFPYTKENVADYLLKKIREGRNLILLHFNPVDIEALEEIVPVLKAQGYTFTYPDGSVPKSNYIEPSNNYKINLD